MPRDDDRRRSHRGGGGRGGRRDDEDDEEVEESGIQAQLPTRLQLGVLVGTGVSVCGPASFQLPVRSRSRPAASTALVLTLVADFTSSTCPVTSAYLSYARIDFSIMENVTVQQQSYEEGLSFELPPQMMFLAACATAAFGVCALAAGARAAGAGTENGALYFMIEGWSPQVRAWPTTSLRWCSPSAPAL